MKASRITSWYHLAIAFRLSAELKQAIDDQAYAKRQSMSDFVHDVLSGALLGKTDG